MSTPSLRERLRAQLADLKMPGALEAVDDILRRTDAGELAAGEAMHELLGSHIRLRNQRRLQTAMRAARLPAVKTLADFDFAFQPALKRDQIESLHTLAFIERKENVVFLGPPGVGKTHCEIGSGPFGSTISWTLSGATDRMTPRLIGGGNVRMPLHEICLLVAAPLPCCRCCRPDRSPSARRA